MKAIRLAAMVILLFCSPAFSKDKTPVETHVIVLSIKNEIFHFKVSKDFLGAVVVILNQEGLVVHSEKVVKRKTIVDFFHRDPGNYTIKITKGEITETFECSINIR